MAAGTLAACFRPLPDSGRPTGGGGGRFDAAFLCRRGLHPSDLVCSLLLPLCLCPPAVWAVPSSCGLCLVSTGLCCSSWITYCLDCRPGGSAAWLELLAAGLSAAAAAAAACVPDWAAVVCRPEEGGVKAHLSEGLITYLPDRAATCLVYWLAAGLLCWAHRAAFGGLVRCFPGSFTAGEAALAVQAGLLTLASIASRLVTSRPSVWAARFLDWLLLKVTSTTPVLLIISWAVLVCISVGMVALYRARGWPVNTRTRKIFHLAVVLVYLSGLAWDPDLLLVASIGATLLFVSLEGLRWSRLLPHLSDLLDQNLKPFLDEKEGGPLILTNIYLLVGVSLPLWIWPHPLLTPAPPLPLYAGILSVGIGDTFASLTGSRWGRHHWGHSLRTVEGSAGGLAAVLLSGLLLSRAGLLAIPSWTTFSCAAVVTAGFEALSGQVDNITLPLVMYAGLVWAM